MVFNPLFIQNTSSRDSAMLGKAGGLKGKGYLFSDMMQVYLGSKAGTPGKLEQFLAANSEIDADEAKSNLFKLTEGNIPSQNDVKFELLLQFLGVTSEELPEQTGLSLEIPKVSAEELQAMLSKITANADNESELNKVIGDKLLKKSEDGEENLLVTLQFNNKTIAIDIVPFAPSTTAGSANINADSEGLNSGQGASTFNMTVSILPSDVSESIISKFVESTHLLKKEAEGTAQINTTDLKKLNLIQGEGQTNIAETKAKSQIDDLVSKAAGSAPDLAKKITIYSVVSETTSAEAVKNGKVVETPFSNPLKQIKFNNQTASLTTANETGNVKIKSDVSAESQIPKAGSSFIPEAEAQTTKTVEFQISAKTDNPEGNVKSAASQENNFAAKILKEGDVANNLTKPSMETFSEDSKVVSSSQEKSASKETLSAQVLQNLINGSDKKASDQNKASVNAESTKQANTQSPTNANAETKSTEFVIPSNDKVTISIKKTPSDGKAEVLKAQPEINKEVKVSEETKQNSPKQATDVSSVKGEVFKEAKLPEEAKVSSLKQHVQKDGVVNEEKQAIKVEESKGNNTVVAHKENIKQEAVTKDNAGLNISADKNQKNDVVPENNTDKINKTFETKITAETKNVESTENVKEKADKNESTKLAAENGSNKIKDAKEIVQNPIENKIPKETVSKEKTEEIIKDNSVKPNETVNAKTEVEPEKPSTQTTVKEGDVLREISGTNNSASEQRQSQHSDHQPNTILHHTHNVDQANNKVSFDEVLTNNQAQKVVKQSEVVKEVHRFVERKDGNQLVLKVEPADLGKVKVTLEMVDKIVKVNVEVESEVIKQALEKSMNDLSQQLNKSGLQLGSVNISLQNADKGNKQNQPNKKKSNNNVEGGNIVENETGETQAGKSLGYNTYDYVV